MRPRELLRRRRSPSSSPTAQTTRKPRRNHDWLCTAHWRQSERLSIGPGRVLDPEAVGHVIQPHEQNVVPLEVPPGRPTRPRVQGAAVDQDDGKLVVVAQAVPQLVGRELAPARRWGAGGRAAPLTRERGVGVQGCGRLRRSGGRSLTGGSLPLPAPPLRTATRRAWRHRRGTRNKSRIGPAT
eukprot:scaffold2702_cov116-Isochrysis_galbana.AAC.10